MRILFIHNRYLQRGGEDAAVEAETDLMRVNGHEVELLLFDNADIGEGALAKLTSGINSIYSRDAARRVKSKINTFRPQIVHVHNFYFSASPSVITAAHAMGVPVVLTLHNYRTICANCHLLRDNKVCELCVSHKFPWHGVRYKCYHNSALHSAVVGSIAAFHKMSGTWRNKVARFITPAEFMKQRLVNSSLNVPAELFSVKRNFIADPGPGLSLREDFYLFVGRLSGEKGVAVLLEAFRYMPEKKLLLAGDGPERESLMTAYGNLGNITFLGMQDRARVLDLMRACRALIFPSIWYEGLPLTIVEAFASGTPVIASRIGSMTEMITHGENGLLFKAGDSNELISTINLFEQSNTEVLGPAARKSYETLYSPEACYTEVMNIYNSVLHKSTHE